MYSDFDGSLASQINFFGRREPSTAAGQTLVKEQAVLQTASNVRVYSNQGSDTVFNIDTTDFPSKRNSHFEVSTKQKAGTTLTQEPTSTTLTSSLNDNPKDETNSNITLRNSTKSFSLMKGELYNQVSGRHSSEKVSNELSKHQTKWATSTGFYKEGMIALPRNNPLMDASMNKSGPAGAWGRSQAAQPLHTASLEESENLEQADFSSLNHGRPMTTASGPLNDMEQNERTSWKPGGSRSSEDYQETINVWSSVGASSQSLLHPASTAKNFPQFNSTNHRNLPANDDKRVIRTPASPVRQLRHAHSMPVTPELSTLSTTNSTEPVGIYSRNPDLSLDLPRTVSTHNTHGSQGQLLFHSNSLGPSISQLEREYSMLPYNALESSIGVSTYDISPESPVSAIQLGQGHDSVSEIANTTVARGRPLNAGAYAKAALEKSNAKTQASGERRSPPPPTKQVTRGTPQQYGSSSGSSNSRAKSSGSTSPKPHQTQSNRINPTSPRLNATRPPPHQSGPGHGGGGSGPGTGGTGQTGPVHNHGPRTPPEILKTLLRKKACLYEAGGTSYAISMVTWLVGRSLALKTGYFTRQELQFGVHSVVNDIIESGSITRTKVNRCMQIILNSCFHYIIPSMGGALTGPAGSGSSVTDAGNLDDFNSAKKFREQFANRAANDEDLLWTLDAPWLGLDVEESIRELIDMVGVHKDGSFRHTNVDITPSSPKLTYQGRTTNAPDSPKERNKVPEDDDSSLGSSKRVVLLCFNENVNSFDDVWRCHNEFIRDVAHSGSLRLTAKEWKEFFMRVTSTTTNVGASSASQPSPTVTSHCDTTAVSSSTSDDGSRFSPSTRSSPSRPVGVPPVIPEFSLDDGHRIVTAAPASYAAAATSQSKKHATDMDTRFVSMDLKELHKFRTTWCGKRYDHDASVCAFSHAHINGGWLRRNPQVYRYRDEFCPHVELVRPNSQHFLEGCLINRCPDGVDCQFSHSQEEIDYHPDRYKKQAICPSFKDGTCTDLFELCDRGLACPFLHPSPNRGGGAHNFHVQRRGGSDGPVRHGKGHSRSTKGRGQHGDQPFSAGANLTPEACIMIYVDPAPTSEFEKYIALPGLKSLFRQRCAVSNKFLQKTMSSATDEVCPYTLFGYSTAF